MKEIKAIIQPHKVLAVTDALQAVPGVGGITAVDVRGFGVERGMFDIEKPALGSVNYTKKVLLLLVVRDEVVEAVLRALQEFAHTGHFGDGVVVVSNVEDAVRLRTGQRGEKAM